MSSDDDPFREFEHTYGSAVDDVIAFSHQGHAFFTQAKVTHMVDLVTRRLGPADQVSVLDVGCGPGVTDAMLQPSVGSLTGVDVSEPMVAQARRTNPKGTYLAHDGHGLPFDDDTFDVSFAVCVLHHVAPSQWQAFVDEMGRVTRSGGLAVVFEHNPANPLTRKAVNDCAFDEGVTLLGRGTTLDLMRTAGMRPVERRHILFLPVTPGFSHVTDKVLGWVPLGGQYYVAGSPS